MLIRSSLVIFLALMITSCISQSRQPPDNIQVEVIGDVAGAYPGTELGVTVDENLQVVDLDPQGAAHLAGIQVGDMLIDLTLVEISANTPMPSDHISMESPMSTPTATIEAPPLSPEAGIDNNTVVVSATLPSEASEDIAAKPEAIEPIPFTDREKIKGIIGLGATVRVRVNRGGEVIEITLRTTPPAPRPNSPTPTAVMPPYDYF